MAFSIPSRWTGVAKYDVSKKDLTVKESPYELKFNDDKGEVASRMLNFQVWRKQQRHDI